MIEDKKHGPNIGDTRISLETAQLAKKKKFAAFVRGSYTLYHKKRRDPENGTSGPFGWKEGEVEEDGDYIANFGEADFSCKSYEQYAAPSQSVMQKWLREEHEVNVYCMYRAGRYRYWVDKVSPSAQENTTYEEALELGLQEGLKKLT